MTGAGDDELVAAFDAVVRAQATLAAELSARTGVHERALQALTLISDTGYSTPTEVAGYLRLTSGAVTNMVDRLTTAGLIERLPNPADRRGSLLRLTDAGTEVVADLRRRYTDALRAVAGEDPGTLQATLAGLANALLESAVASHTTAQDGAEDR